MGNIATSAEDADHCAEVLKAVGHPIRLRAVAILCAGPCHVNGLAEALGAPQPTVSQHLRVLRMAGLVAVTRQDGLSHYSIAEPGLVDLVECVERCGGRRGGRRDVPGGAPGCEEDTNEG